MSRLLSALRRTERIDFHYVRGSHPSFVIIGVCLYLFGFGCCCYPFVLFQPVPYRKPCQPMGRIRFAFYWFPRHYVGILQCFALFDFPRFPYLSFATTLVRFVSTDGSEFPLLWLAAYSSPYALRIFRFPFRIIPSRFRTDRINRWDLSCFVYKVSRVNSTKIEYSNNHTHSRLCPDWNMYIDSLFIFMGISIVICKGYARNSIMLGTEYHGHGIFRAHETGMAWILNIAKTMPNVRLCPHGNPGMCSPEP